ncbi:cell division protein FtsQ/DivIB [Staphylococcus agnetis]|uniref:cell division protein FtsQ/DivIB n=1 Tax=Staphylococcus agnetis TaxID=985762 RepID=UPI000D1A8AB3|nr:FtsQ-type POTRA domain-containing protein [Staphylococcus agnetis]NJH85827.1 FtsQ-type POTRA domain-containing protein [Staphylococcus agnetis]NJI16608.1 FtsQ-type POTRA domain-containing protein [Staphylococcus agnetis]PTH40660.1 cell division protein DivIB [Staphylococcus agnetis]
MSEPVRKIDNEYIKEKRRKQLKKRRRFQRNLVLGLVIIVFCIALFMFTPISKVHDAEVNGTHFVPKNDVKKELQINHQPRVYAYDSKAAIERLEKNPLIKSIEIHKAFPNTIIVDVKEHDIVGITQEKDKVVPIIETGKVIKDFKGTVPNEVPFLNGFKGSEKRKMVEALQKMDQTTRAQISEINFAPEKDQPNLIRLYMRDGIEVLGKTTTIAKKLEYYPSMSQALEKDEAGKLKKSGYIDLSVGATFIPYANEKNNDNGSASSQELQSGTATEDKAKDDLQKALNKIKENEKE